LLAVVLDGRIQLTGFATGSCRISATVSGKLHRLVDLGFPEHTRYVRRLNSEVACAILHDYATAQAFQGVSVKRLARLRFDGRDMVGDELAGQLVEAAKRSVGQHHGDSRHEKTVDARTLSQP
jgi:hypothetical protein